MQQMFFASESSYQMWLVSSLHTPNQVTRCMCSTVLLHSSRPLTVCLGTSTGTIVGSFFGGIVVGCLSTLLVVGIVGGIVMFKKKQKTVDKDADKGKV